MAKVWIGVRTRVAYLRRLSVVFAVELRLRIVTELYMREMSPTQFFNEFGGGSVSRVDRNFKKLAEHGWLRYIRSEGPGGERRGATEYFYRATELAVFDYETWSLLPYSIRVAYSWKAYRQLAERVRGAMRTGTFDSRADRHLSWTPLLLDRQGWDRVIEAVDALFVSLFEEQADARLRIYRSGEEAISAIAALIVFESPKCGAGRVGPRLIDSKEPLVPLPVRLSKVFADELCLTIVAEANLKEVSAPSFHAEHGGDSVESIRRRLKMLERVGWLTQTNQKSGGRRRGATELFYRATAPAIFDNCSWADVPDATKAAHSWTTFEHISKRVREAMKAGTFDARDDRYLTWSLLRLDESGWQRLIDAYEGLFAFIFEEADKAEARMAVSCEEPTTVTVALAAFEAPETQGKEP